MFLKKKITSLKYLGFQGATLIASKPFVQLQSYNYNSLGAEFSFPCSAGVFNVFVSIGSCVLILHWTAASVQVDNNGGLSVIAAVPYYLIFFTW